MEPSSTEIIQDNRAGALRRMAGRGLALLAVGLLLFLLTLPALYVLPLGGMEDIARALYRVVFFICLPAHALVTPIAPRINHDWHLFHFVAACLVTPFIWYGLWRGWRRIFVAGAVREKESGGQERAGRLSRRQFIQLTGTAVPVVAGGGVGAYSVLVAPQRLHVRRYLVPIRDLPGALEGVRFVQVSDTHFGPYVSESYLKWAIEEVNRLDGDVALLTGDYVHQTPRSIELGIRLMADIEARLGVVAVLGNHDHWEGADACRSVFADVGIPLIDNARLFLAPEGLRENGEEGECLCLSGAGDLWADEVSFARALRNVPESMPRIMLAHNPDTAEMLTPQYRVDLMCSGHTHGGQVDLPGIGTPIIPSRYGKKYAGGLVRGPQCPVIVSRGVGMALFPIRFRVPPELVVIELVRQEPPLLA